jgi:His-Xaa-Ser system radical SAM maturase HxsB
MTQHDASRAIDLMLSVPARTITMEFQGGEPLLAFDLVRWMVETTAERASRSGKDVNYVICTNLTILNDNHLKFFKEYAVVVSTSLDGPAEIHDRNRPSAGISAHAIVTANIRRCHKELGPGSVSALMTTTSHSLQRAQDIIDEYVACDLGLIFLREINPYGFAAKSAKSIGYGTDDFVAFYHEILDRIIDLNRQGIRIAEGYASILLRKILTPFGVGFVDLQSPTGEGFGVVLYNYDGAVYASDEARMLAEMGDESFRLGSVSDTYADLMLGETMQLLAAAGVAEALPGCSDCVYVPYCGADPIRHYRTQGDIIGHRSTSEFCRKQKAIFNIIFELLSGANHQTIDIFLGWLNPHRSCLPKPTWQS